MEIKANEEGVSVSMRESPGTAETQLVFEFKYYAVVNVSLESLRNDGSKAIYDAIPTGIKELHDAIKNKIAEWNVK